jgi:hypothetical protein
VEAADETSVPTRSCGKSGRCQVFGTDDSRTRPQEMAQRNLHTMSSPVRRVPRVQVLGFRSSHTPPEVGKGLAAVEYMYETSEPEYQACGSYWR